MNSQAWLVLAGIVVGGILQFTLLTPIWKRKKTKTEQHEHKRSTRGTAENYLDSYLDTSVRKKAQGENGLSGRQG